MAKFSKRARLSVDVSPAELREIGLAAERRGQATGEYVREAVTMRLAHERTGSALALRQAEDPVLGELWDNPRDAVYDQL